VRASVVLFVLGEALLLAGVGMWSIPLAMVLAGIQCTGLALFREHAAAAPAARQAASKPDVRRHRRTGVRSLLTRRPKLRLVGRGAA
jgi:hypothetical protein